MQTSTTTVPTAAPTAFGDSREELTLLRTQLEDLAAIADLVSRLEATDDLNASCQMLARHLAEHLGAAQVFVGTCPPDSRRCRVAAGSANNAGPPTQEQIESAQGVLQEVLARGELTHWPAPTGETPSGLFAHRQFAELNRATELQSGPLRDTHGRVRGAWMFTDIRLERQRAVRFLQAAESPIASALRLVERAQRGWLSRHCDVVWRGLRRRRGRACMIAVAATALALCVPVTHRPRCDCTVEPVKRRYVAAPFDGPLAKSFVEPGDEVQRDDLLARMDGREVNWELAGTRADLHRATKERAGYLATHESGQAEVARFEVDRLRVRNQLLEDRAQHLEIRSPITGVVVSGDWRDAEGMPLKRGKTLFEVAPLDTMSVEVSVPQHNYPHVRAGMPVVIRLDALSVRRLTGRIERVHPRSEVRDDENVFVAEVRIDNEDNTLRPGMRGTATITSDRRMLGWVLLRRPFTALITRLGW